jgi:hypothetical protein
MSIVHMQSRKTIFKVQFIDYYLQYNLKCKHLMVNYSHLVVHCYFLVGIFILFKEHFNIQVMLTRF